MVTALIISIPGWIRQSERWRVAESHAYLASIRDAQERFRAENGCYTDDLAKLDLDRPEPTFFAVGEVHPGLSGDLVSSWTLTLTRFGDDWFCDPYSVTCTEQGLLSQSRSLRTELSHD